MSPTFITLAPPVPQALLPARPALPRVLYALTLDPGRKYGSLEEQITQLAHAFRGEGSLFLPLFICAPESANVEQFRRRGVSAECLELRGLRLATLWKLWRLVQRRRIHAIHWNFTNPLLNPYVWSLSVLAPTVRHAFTDHNSRTHPQPPPRGWRKLVKRVLLKRYRQVWGVSQHVVDDLAGHGVWSNLICCRHFINTDRFRPDPAERARERAGHRVADKFVLVVVGQLIHDKGIDVAIRAMAELPDDAVLWIAGAGPEEANLRNLIAELKLEGRVRLLGLQRDVQPLLQAADVFVCPSRWAEAAGLVNLEAQACGVPVVASRVGGIPEYVDDGVSGILVDAGAAGQLAAAVRRLHANRDLHERMRGAARAAALARFAPAARLPAILDLYRNL
ncbi:MAG: glycosyltransferase [Gemmataceae bacterium]|nr:glycosyltransferase [Gemmataceae bacterium]